MFKLLLALIFNCVHSEFITKDLRLKIKNQVFENCFENIIKNDIINSFNVITEGKQKAIDFPVPYFGKTVINFENIHLLKMVKDRPTSFIISFRNVFELNETLSQISSANYYWKTHLIRYIIILNDKRDLKESARLLGLYKYYKSTLLLVLKSRVKIYTIGFEQCGETGVPVKVNECYGRTFKRTSTFETDIKTQFYKCPFRVIWSRVTPWINNMNGTESGIFIDLIKVYRDASQFDVVYMPPNDIYLEELSAEFRFDSMVEDLNNGSADLFVGFTSFLSSLKVASIYLTGTYLYMIVPKPEKIPYWKNILMIFSLPSWISISLTFSVVVIVFYLLALGTTDKRKFGSLWGIFFYIFTVGLNIGCHKAPENTRSRILAGSWMFYTLIIVAVTQGKLFSFMSKPPLEKPITNLKELVATDIPIKDQDALKLLYILNEQINKEYLKKVESIEGMNFNTKVNLAYKEKFSTTVDEGVLIMQPNVTKAMQYFVRTDIMNALFMPFYHVLNEYFEKSILRIVESGFLCQSKSKWKHFYYLRIEMEADDDPVFSISVSQTESAFVILIFGTTLALLIFISEHLIAFIQDR